jgi:hypothetical protein
VRTVHGWYQTCLICWLLSCWLVLWLVAVQEALEEVRAERRERAQLGAPAPYTRIYFD